VEAWRLNVVIYYQLTFCHTLNIEAVEVERVLQSIGVRMYKIDTDYSEQGAEAIRTRLESFLETLGGGKGHAPAQPPGGAPAPQVQAAPLWMSITLPPELAGELPMVSATRVPSGPLSKPKAQATQPHAPAVATAQPTPAPQPAAPPAAQPVPPPRATQMTKFRLVTSSGQEIPLSRDNSYILGRDSSKSPTEIDLTSYGGDASQGVSRSHARLVVTRSRCFLEDLGSKNGTYVNGRRLGSGERCPMTGGEQVTLGRFTLRVLKS